MVSLEIRKIQRVGQSTLSISLPKTWTTRAGLKPGDNLYLNIFEDDALRILTENGMKKEKKSQEYSINLDKIHEPSHLEQLIITSYLLGVETIIIFASNRIVGKQIDATRNTAKLLVGVSIIEASQKKIILQCLIDSSKVNLFSLIKRLHITTSTMLTEAIDALNEFDVELADCVVHREEEANTLYFLITRLILQAHRSETWARDINMTENGFNDILSYRVVTLSLDRIADCARNIAKYVINLNQRNATLNNVQLQKLSLPYTMVKDVFNKSLDSLFSENILTAIQVINQVKHLEDKLAIDLLVTPNVPYYYPIAIMLSLIAHNSLNVAYITVNNAVRKSMR